MVLIYLSGSYLGDKKNGRGASPGVGRLCLAVLGPVLAVASPTRLAFALSLMRPAPSVVGRYFFVTFS